MTKGIWWDGTREREVVNKADYKSYIKDDLERREEGKKGEGNIE